MGFGVFIHRTDSIYDDSPAKRYQFPSQYLGRVQSCVGDWIIYYEPRKVAATRGYFAVAKVARVIADPKAPGMYLALIEPGSYLDFVNAVPFSGPDGVIESGVLNEVGRISGRAQAAVRPISPVDFNRILSMGLAEDQPELPRFGEATETSGPSGFSDSAQAPFMFEQERARVTQLSSRIVRDRLFRRLILQAYNKRCAITGLKLINGGGRAEVDAAHIRPVDANGPDILSNGIALSGTAHWMFDRGLIGLSDELEVLVSRYANDRDSIQGLINQTRRAIVPAGIHERPHPQFLQWHRENTFKH
ncbi:restriction endonuclease [Rhizobiaceae bacterium CRRU44]|uniref:Restriction endonuclease n=1 Tax=Ferranicluibacter rubi TaxID=2715133 RepID=A0AA43ZHI2_9HYPH|nr:HNH endonuclease [Ferranicluibacter rubi]NHT77130.1 restriction endonuclease [Ferranicluibacter rubi]